MQPDAVSILEKPVWPGVRGGVRSSAKTSIKVRHAAFSASASWSTGGWQHGLCALVWLLAFFSLRSLALAGTTYYVATNGVTSNTGLTTNSPWPITYALLNVPASNAIIVMPGTYNTNLVVRHSYQTLQSQTKWAAKINIPGGVNSAGIAVWPPPIDHVTIDGFEVANAGRVGIAIYGSNCVARNCWIHNSGRGGNSNDGSGISAYGTQSNLLIEDNLLENNGFSVNFDHGIYISGTNCVVRNNVCRGTSGQAFKFTMAEAVVLTRLRFTIICATETTS